jgi:hypothetical protein
MSDEGQRAQETTGDSDQMVIDQAYRSELDEAIAWRDRFIAWQTDRMRGNACTEDQIEAMARKALDMPYAFWIQAMSRRPGNLVESTIPSSGRSCRMAKTRPVTAGSSVRTRWIACRGWPSFPESGVAMAHPLNHRDPVMGFHLAGGESGTAAKTRTSPGDVFRDTRGLP